MARITSKRGTSTVSTQGLIFGKKSSAVPKNESITVNLGTKVVKTADIPNVSKPSLKGQKITVKRGTEVITL